MVREHPRRQQGVRGAPTLPWTMMAIEQRADSVISEPRPGKRQGPMPAVIDGELVEAMPARAENRSMVVRFVTDWTDEDSCEAAGLFLAASWVRDHGDPAEVNLARPCRTT